jgi:hypothetical protein
MIVQADRMVPDAHVLHPLLAVGAAMHAHWGGSLALHGGVVGINARAWVLLGGERSGKTTLLAAMAARGYDVLADDLAVVTPDRVVYSGPRCLDVRRSAAAVLAPESPSFPVRHHRVRVQLADVPDSLPLGGFVELRWGRRIGIESLTPSQRATLVVDARTAWGPASAHALLDVVSARCFALVRPIGLVHLDVSIDRLVSAVRDEPGLLDR